jgi:hypothetical protein
MITIAAIILRPTVLIASDHLSDRSLRPVRSRLGQRGRGGGGAETQPEEQHQALGLFRALAARNTTYGPYAHLTVIHRAFLSGSAP